MLYRHITDRCFADSPGKVDGLLKRLAPHVAALVAHKPAPAAALIDVAARTQDLAGIEKLAKELRGRFHHAVVVGTGGSGLSGRMLVSLRPNPAMQFHFLDSIDPDGMDAVLAAIDVKNTCFIIISRSGSTVETFSQFCVLRRHVAANLGEAALSEQFVIITLPGDNPLRRIAQQDGMRILDHDRDVGGRFAVLTNVGLLPAALAGLDIAALRRGAATVTAQLAPDCPAALGATLHYAAIDSGHNISVMLAYAERLALLSAWWRQCWAESLGKNGKGSTPVRALGTTDQHSQLQLYLDGPKDKFFTLLTVKRTGTGPRIDAPDAPELAYLKGRTLGDVMQAEQKATLETLARARCPVRLFALDSLAEEQVGALLMHFMLEIFFTACLLEVNAFDQPAVEAGKELARDYLLKGNL